MTFKQLASYTERNQVNEWAVVECVHYGEYNAMKGEYPEPDVEQVMLEPVEHDTEFDYEIRAGRFPICDKIYYWQSLHPIR